jgi:hypothetical protein
MGLLGIWLQHDDQERFRTVEIVAGWVDKIITGNALGAARMGSRGTWYIIFVSEHAT